MRACKAFFDRLEAAGLAVTYDDVRLRTRHSRVAPTAVQLESRISVNVELKTPIVSAAMDTVTSGKMATAMAMSGGIGVVHCNYSPKEQRDEVRRVKFHLSAIIMSPITVRDNETIGAIQNLRREKRWKFHTFPVVDENGRLVGLLTENDFDFASLTDTAADVMTRELVTAEPGTTIDQAWHIMRQRKKKVLPLIDERGLQGMYLFSDLKRVKSGSTATYNLDGQGRLRVAAAVPVGLPEDVTERIELLRDYADVIVVESSHADTDPGLETIKLVRRLCNIDIVAGNISEYDSVKPLVDAGVAGIKVGQGGGSICITRITSGIGCPQVTAINEVVKALEDLGCDLPVCADGGIEYTGAIPIAIGAGAHSVMLGKLLAGTDEAPGEVDRESYEIPVKRYRGMGSLEAMEARAGSRARYGQIEAKKDELVAEGVSSVVPYVGDVRTVMRQYLGGLRAGMGYTGSGCIEELRQTATFWRITSSGVRESHPHGVRIVRNPPNYTPRGSDD